jgi:PAS domain S-box-containing protein
LTLSFTSLYLLKKERRKAGKRVDDLKAEFTSLINSWERVNIYILDTRYRYVHFNEFHKKEIKRVFGVDIEIGQNKLNLLPLSLRSQYKSLYDKALGGSGFSHTQKFGDDFIKFDFIPQRNEQGKIVTFTTLAANITEQIRHEQELENYRQQLESIVEKRSQNIIGQRNFFQTVIDEIPSHIFVRNHQGQYVLVNKSFSDFNGFEKSDCMIEKSIFDVHKNAADAEKIFEEDKELLSSGLTTGSEIKIDTDQKQSIWMYLTKKRIAMGDEYFVLGVQSDITHLKDTQTALERTNEDLKIALQEVHSFQLKLIESEKLATVGQLTAGLIHEINNPINYVSGNVEPIKRDIEDLKEWIQDASYYKNNPDDVHIAFEEMENLLRGIEDGADRVKDLMQSLKSLSRPDESETVKFDINKGIYNTINLIRPTVKNRISFETDFGELQEIECNPGQLQQVFLNLIENAVDAIQNQGLITVTTSFQAPYNHVEIVDDGIGIKEEHLSQVFEPFFTTKEYDHGSGLGLSIARRIVRELGGSLNLESNGTGTKAIIKIPSEK